MALLRLPQNLSGADVPEFGSLSEIRMLDEVFTIGSPNRVKFVASLGYVTKKDTVTGDCGTQTHCILYSIPVAGGNSGGAYF